MRQNKVIVKRPIIQSLSQENLKNSLKFKLIDSLRSNDPLIRSLNSPLKRNMQVENQDSSLSPHKNKGIKNLGLMHAPNSIIYKKPDFLYNGPYINKEKNLEGDDTRRQTQSKNSINRGDLIIPLLDNNSSFTEQQRKPLQFQPLTTTHRYQNGMSSQRSFLVKNKDTSRENSLDRSPKNTNQQNQIKIQKVSPRMNLSRKQLGILFLQQKNQKKLQGQSQAFLNSYEKSDLNENLKEQVNQKFQKASNFKESLDNEATKLFSRSKFKKNQPLNKSELIPNDVSIDKGQIHSNTYSNNKYREQQQQEKQQQKLQYSQAIDKRMRDKIAKQNQKKNQLSLVPSQDRFHPVETSLIQEDSFNLNTIEYDKINQEEVQTLKYESPPRKGIIKNIRNKQSQIKTVRDIFEVKQRYLSPQNNNYQGIENQFFSPETPKNLKSELDSINIRQGKKLKYQLSSLGKIGGSQSAEEGFLIIKGQKQQHRDDNNIRLKKKIYNLRDQKDDDQSPSSFLQRSINFLPPVDIHESESSQKKATLQKMDFIQQNIIEEGKNYKPLSKRKQVNKFY